MKWLVSVFVVLFSTQVFAASVSESGLEMIKHHEGTIYQVYADEAGYLTAGTGHLLTAAELKVMKKGDKVSANQVDNWLRQDLKIAEQTVDRLVKVELTQSQNDALVSFVFNIGMGNFANSTLLSKLNKGDYTGASAEFPRWKYTRGKVSKALINRRNDERKLFESAE